MNAPKPLKAHIAHRKTRARPPSKTRHATPTRKRSKPAGDSPTSSPDHERPTPLHSTTPDPDYHQFSLLRFTTKEDLTRIVNAFCDLTHLSGGVVAVPEDPARPPEDERLFDNYRLTPPGAINQYDFCRLVRQCSAGNSKCMWSDLSESANAAKEGEALPYRCHLGLVDIVAPIKVAGHHVANVYLGEIRLPDLKFESVWPKYRKLLKLSGTIREQATKAKLRKAFYGLPVRRQTQLPAYIKTTNILAELISQRATRQAAVVVNLDAAHEIGASLNLRANLSICLHHALRLLNATTGTIFLLDEAKQSLKLTAHAWPQPITFELSMPLDGPGIAAKCAVENLRRYHGDLKKQYDAVSSTQSRACVIRAGTREEIDSHGDPLIPASRDVRALQSLLVVPITCGHELLGVMDVGCPRLGAYSADDEHVLRLIARQIGLHVRYTTDRQSLLSVFAENDPQHLGRVLAREIPRHVQGNGCSIFLKEKERNRATLFASDEFTDEVKEEVYYEVGEGLTGWVLKTGRTLNLRAGPKCRTDNLPQVLKEGGLTWKGKYAQKHDRSRKYWEDRPYLAVPIRGDYASVAGVIRLSDRRSDSFTAADESMLQAFADCLGLVLRFAHTNAAVRAARRPKHVFLGYGHNPDAKRTIEEFIRTLPLVLESYETRTTPGQFPYNIVTSAVQESDAAVILYTGDDQLTGGQRIGRRNVAYELGLAHSAFGPTKTLLLLEEGVEEPTNIRGMQVVTFKTNALSAKLADIRDSLRRMHLLD
jgi:predicted nucleotide-binding protein